MIINQLIKSFHKNSLCFQIAYLNLDTDYLCSLHNPSSLTFAMREWEKNESPSLYWFKKFRQLYSTRRLDEITLDYYIHGSNHPSVQLINGLPVKEAQIVCKEFYKKNIAKVKFEIADENVEMKRRDFSVTFAEQLSIISSLATERYQHVIQISIFYQAEQSVSSLE